MRRSHVYERSVPRVARRAYHETGNPAVTARTIAAQLGNMIERADQAGMAEIGDMLAVAQRKAEQLSRE